MSIIFFKGIQTDKTFVFESAAFSLLKEKKNRKDKPFMTEKHRFENGNRKDIVVVLFSWKGTLISSITFHNYHCDSCLEAGRTKAWLTLIWWGWWTITTRHTIRQTLTHESFASLREEVWEGRAKDVSELLRISGGSQAASQHFYSSGLSSLKHLPLTEPLFLF